MKQKIYSSTRTFNLLYIYAAARESSAKAEYFNSLSERVKKIIYRDIRYNIDYLYTAYVLDDKKIMNTYAVWLYELMVGIHKQRFTREQTKAYVIFHLEAIKKSIPDLVTLSVSMPQHLMDCEQAVREIKQEFPGVKVAVGGKAFESTNIAKFAVIT